MMYKESTFIWEIIPLIEYTQFPWRLLVIVSFGLSFISGGIVLFLTKKNRALSKEVFSNDKVIIKRKNKIILLITILLISGVIVWNFDFSELLPDLQKFPGNTDYLPIQVQRGSLGEISTHTPFFIDGDGNIYNFTKGSNWQKFTADATTDKARIRLQLFDFPGWQVLVNGEKAIINNDNELGLITFDVFKGTNEIIVSLNKTKKQLVADTISLLSWIFLVGALSWSIYIIKKGRKFKNYK